MNKESYEPYKYACLEEAIPRLNHILFEEDIIWRLALDEQPLPGDVLVDIDIFRFAVTKARAQHYQHEVADILSLYPSSYYPDLTHLEDGPNYLELGAALDSQRTALWLCAYGEAVGFWRVQTPRRTHGDVVSREFSITMIELIGDLSINGYRAPVDPD